MKSNGLCASLLLLNVGFVCLFFVFEVTKSIPSGLLKSSFQKLWSCFKSDTRGAFNAAERNQAWVKGKSLRTAVLQKPPFPQDGSLLGTLQGTGQGAHELWQGAEFSEGTVFSFLC